MKILLSSFLFALACQPASKPPEPATPDPQVPPPTTPADTPEPTVKRSPFVGFWTSPSCGERTYERRIQIREDGSVEVWDRVSPCPPTVTCVWSGVARGLGQWEAKGDTVHLTYAKVYPNEQHRPKLLTSLTWDAAGKAPSEDSVEPPCVYTPFNAPTEEAP